MNGNFCELRRLTTAGLDTNKESRLLSWIHKHYIRSSVIINDATHTCLHSKALRELRSFRYNVGGDHLYKYLYDYWYRESFWILWGRRHKNIALSQMTLKVEAHRSVLKSHFCCSSINLEWFFLRTLLLFGYSRKLKTTTKRYTLEPKSHSSGNSFQKHGNYKLLLKAPVSLTIPTGKRSHAAVLSGIEISFYARIWKDLPFPQYNEGTIRRDVPCIVIDMCGTVPGPE